MNDSLQLIREQMRRANEAYMAEQLRERSQALRDNVEVTRSVIQKNRKLIDDQS